MLKVENLTFTYPGRGEPTLRDVTLKVSRGEFVLVTGPTGCGKSTLLKTINGLIPHESGGRLKGKVVVDRKDTHKSSLSEITQRVGLVFQSPDDQIFSSMVENEVAFGPENLCLRREVIEERVRESLDLVGLGGFRERVTSTLSGGEKQRLAIASVLAM
ncbi:MAG: ABC transporter ATP-binding protein, partial [Deltaproteobacteria bacterium]